MTTIEYSDESWNPIITGCTAISPGCLNCYAMGMAKRLQGIGYAQYQGVVNKHGWTGKVKITPNLQLNKPLLKKKPTVYFVNSMADLHHKNVPIETLYEIWEVMAQTPQHTYQIFTKRASLLPERIGLMVKRFGVLPNVWQGVSVESQKYFIERVPHLFKLPVAVRFLSCEPLLGPLDLGMCHAYVDWIIVGGESGPGARPMQKEWVFDIKAQCELHETPFYFKQWGGVRKKDKGRLLDGRLYEQMPNKPIAKQLSF